MKRNRKHNMFGWLAASALLLTTACTDTADLATEQGGTNATSIVTLTVQTPLQAGGTRADGDLNTWYTNFGKGSEVDILIFAVYEKKQKEGSDDEYTYTLLTDYSMEKNKSVTIDGTTINCGTGQNIITFVKDNEKDEHKDGVTIQFATDKTKTYAVAFWAQSSKTNAYNTNDLKEVKVAYNNANNNDESRDAFCAVAIIEENAVTEVNGVAVTDDSNTITLRRPLAQINVGTTGADYNNMLNGNYVYPNKAVTQSKIVLKGVAQCFNVVENKVEVDNTDAKKLVDVTFDYTTIPAFHAGLPTTNEGLLGSTDITGNNEEFLYVDLDDEGIAGYDTEKNQNGYKTEYSTITKDADGNPVFETETFKYLSMCYVLIPEQTSYTDQSAAYGSVLTGVEIYFKGKTKTVTNNNATFSDTDTELYPQPISLKNVPVQRNWRTNILGGLSASNDPTDDQTSIFKFIKGIIEVDPLLENDKNVNYDEEDKKKENWTWSDGTPKTE